MADGHDPEHQTPLAAFLAEGINSREDLETAMMAAIVRQTALLESLVVISKATMIFIDRTTGKEVETANKIAADMQEVLSQCKQISAALSEYAGHSQAEHEDDNH